MVEGQRQAGGTTIRGDADNADAHVDFTRLHDDGHLTLSFYTRQTDARGIVTGTLTGGEINPALAIIAGQPVTSAPAPDGSATLAGFAAGANHRRLYDVSPLHALAPANDTFPAEAVVANRIGHNLGSAPTLTADHSRDASATLTVPAGNPFSRFGDDVLFQGHLVESAPIRRRTGSTRPHASSA